MNYKKNIVVLVAVMIILISFTMIITAFRVMDSNRSFTTKTTKKFNTVIYDMDSRWIEPKFIIDHEELNNFQEFMILEYQLGSSCSYLVYPKKLNGKVPHDIRSEEGVIKYFDENYYGNLVCLGTNNRDKATLTLTKEWKVLSVENIDENGNKTNVTYKQDRDKVTIKNIKKGYSYYRVYVKIDDDNEITLLFK